MKELSKLLNKDDYDYENAFIVDENNNVFRYEEVFGEGFLKSTVDETIIISSEQKEEKIVEKKDNTITKDFKPQFVSKTNRNDNQTVSRENSAKNFNKDEEKPKAKNVITDRGNKNEETNNDVNLKKRAKLNDIVDQFKKEESLIPKNKKVKGNLLSFNDE